MTKDIVEQKVVSMLDALQTGVVEVGHQVVKYAPDVGQAVLGVVQINGINNLAQPLLLSIIMVILLVLNFNKFILLCRRAEEEIVAYVFGGILYLLAMCVAISYTLDIWDWVAIFNPKLALAHKIIQSHH